MSPMRTGSGWLNSWSNRARNPPPIVRLPQLAQAIRRHKAPAPSQRKPRIFPRRPLPPRPIIHTRDLSRGAALRQVTPRFPVLAFPLLAFLAPWRKQGLSQRPPIQLRRPMGLLFKGDSADRPDTPIPGRRTFAPAPPHRRPIFHRTN